MYVHSKARGCFFHALADPPHTYTTKVRMAKKWETVGEQRKCKKTAEQVNLIVPGRSISKTEIVVEGACDKVNVLEHVQAHVTLAASKRGDVQIFLVSPSGTRSNLVAKRPRDYSRAGFNDWPFMTVSSGSYQMQ